MLPGNALFDPENRNLLNVLAEQIAPDKDAAPAPQEVRPNRLLALFRVFRPAVKSQPASARVTGETRPVCS